MLAIKSLFSFQGRVSRSNFWAVTIGQVICFAVWGGVLSATEVEGKSPYEIIFSLIYLPIAFWIGLAVQIKRWHDRDRTGWMFLFNAVPFVGWLYCLIVLAFLKGTPGANRYGPDPLATAASINS